MPVCPECKKDLYPVVQDAHSQLNSEQFDSIRAGDWFCPNCPGNDRGISGYRYYWNSEIPNFCEETGWTGTKEPKMKKMKPGDEIEIHGEETIKVIQSLREQYDDAKAGITFMTHLLRVRHEELFKAIEQAHPELSDYHFKFDHPTNRAIILYKKEK